MSPAPDSTLNDPQKIIADLKRANSELQRRLDESNAERDEALERETATAEVLQVINSSPGDLVPVFDAMLERAMSLCEGSFGELRTYEGDNFKLAAMRNVPPAYAEFMTQNSLSSGPGTGPGRLLSGERIVHIVDLPATDNYRHGEPSRRALVDLGGARTIVLLPLLKDESLLGFIMIYRTEVRAFSEKQIALLQNFAAQAVIAIENARLITETREALQKQTATAEILRVISASPTDLQPTFDAIAARATTLCGAASGGVFRFDGSLIHFLAHYGWENEELQATRNAFPMTPGQGSMTARAITTQKVAHSADVSNEPSVQPLLAQAFRTVLSVPMLHDGNALGAITVTRRQVEPFTEAQIELLQTFADQAVIAIENARLFTELGDALEQQTATAEVLGVINSSPGDLTPVFDAMLERAMRLCEATFGHLATYDGERFHTAAIRGVPAPFAEFRKRSPQVYGPGTGVARLLAGERLVHFNDVADTDAYRSGDPNQRAIVDLGGARTMLVVPLLKDDAVQGFITVYRQEVRPFTDKQIALLQSFAAQAVIAIDNARLLNEIRQRQAELRVTFDNMGDGVAMFDTDLRLTAWNLNFQRILDLSDQVLAPRPTYEHYIRLLAERGEFGTDDIEAELSARLEHTDQELRLERIRPDGHVIEVRRNAVPAGGFVLIYSDVTERKRAEAEIRAARDAAEAAYRDLQAAQAQLVHAQKMAALGQLTAGIAHEIKNPLNFINNFAGLSGELLDELKEAAAPAIATLDADTRAEIDDTVKLLTGNLEKIAEHGQRADGIVKSMLEHSRGGSGDRREIDLNAFIDEALNLAYHGARAQDQSFNITLERDFASVLMPVELAPQEMTRVFLNLFGNGFYAANKRAREDGNQYRPILRVATRATEDGVEIRVRDNGTGIAPEIRDKLFHPFVTTKPTGEGTGLGLSISYEIVTQQHGGTIEVDSEVGQFTEFTVRLPRRNNGGAETRA